jgi:SAM-dependent methyltransferase
MKEFFIEFLICPSCLPEEYSLQENVKQRDGDDIISGELLCPKCRKVFPIRDGVAFLHPTPELIPLPGNKYETPQSLSSYIWGHYGNLMGEEEHIDAYQTWAELVEESPGLAIDIGCAVGRFSLEMSTKSDMVVGVDISLLFIETARKLAKEGKLKVKIFEEGLITREKTLLLPSSWRPEKVEFIIADALNLPFKTGSASVVSSLNVIDKVPSPLRHIKEMDRVSRKSDAQCLISDPFSWSTDSSPIDEWLGGKDKGPFSGYGIENIAKILDSKETFLFPPWQVLYRGHVWWKLRTHRNHFELIRSLFIKAVR